MVDLELAQPSVVARGWGTEEFWRWLREHHRKEFNWLVSLVRAFRNCPQHKRGDAYIWIDNRRQRYQIESAEFARAYGLLERHKRESEQCTVWRYYPTDLGWRVFCDPNAPCEYDLSE